MRIADAERYALEMLHHHHLAGAGWTVRWGRSTTRAGWCGVSARGRKCITFSRPAFRINHADLGRAVIAHEIAHAICYERGLGLRHDDAWATVACEIGGEAACVARTPMQRPRGKQRYRCPVCRTKTERSRAVRDGYQIGCKPCRTDRGVWVALKKVR